LSCCFIVVLPYYPLAQGEADPGAGVFLACVQALKNREQAAEVFRIDTNAIVTDFEYPETAIQCIVLRADMNSRRCIRTLEFDTVADQVLEDLHDLGMVPEH
jgi:hypothetical protein